MQPHDIDTPYRKKRPAKKPFIIEYRCTGGTIYKEWRNHSKYLTERQRDQALENLQGKDIYGVRIFEYRAKP